MNTVKRNSKRKSQNPNLSGESHNKIPMTDTHSGEFTAPRVSSADNSKGDNSCTQSGQITQINHSTPRPSKVSDYGTMDGTGLSPVGPQGPQATFVGVEQLSPIDPNEALCKKIDLLTETVNSMNEKFNSMNEKLKKLDLIETKLSQLDNEVKTVKTSLTGVNKKIREVELSMDFMNTKYEEHKENMESMMTSIDLASQSAEKAERETTTVKNELKAMYQNQKDLRERQIELEARSMRDNLIFSGIAEIPGENPEAVVRTFLKRDMKIRRSIDFERAHRIGRVERDRIRPIVAKFSSYKDREAVRRAAAGALKDTSFGVNEQFPKEINDRRKVLYPHFKAAKRAGHRVSLNVDRLYIDGAEFIPPEVWRPMQQQQPHDAQRTTQQQQPRDVQRTTQQQQPCDVQRITQQQQPRDVQRATQQQQPRDVQRTTQQHQPRDVQRTTQQQQPRDVQRTTQQQQPRDMQRTTQQQQPRDVQRTTQQQQPRDVQRTTQQQQPRDVQRTTQQQQPRGNPWGPQSQR